MSLAVYFDITINGILSGLVYGLAALGLTVIFGVNRVVNFAHGGIMAAGLAVVAHGGDPLQAMPLVAALLFVFGFAVQRLLVERVPEAPEPLRLLLMAGVALIVINGTLLLSGFGHAAPQPAASAASAPLAVGPFLLDRLRVRSALVAVMVTALLFTFFNLSRTGKAIRACADSPLGARLAGLDLSGLQAISFGLGAAVTGIAGCLMAEIVEVRSGPAFDPMLIGFLVVLIGGLGSVGGALLGGVLVGVTEALAGTVLPPTLHGAAGCGLLVLVLLWRPRGLLGDAG
jgi:branched-chain amino acid transport system permease protein